MIVESLAHVRPSAISAFQDGGYALKLRRIRWYAWPMLTQERSKTGQSPSLDAVFVDLVRLAAKNDAPAITRRVRRWVGSPQLAGPDSQISCVARSSQLSKAARASPAHPPQHPPGGPAAKHLSPRCPKPVSHRTNPPVRRPARARADRRGVPRPGHACPPRADADPHTAAVRPPRRRQDDDRRLGRRPAWPASLLDRAVTDNDSLLGDSARNLIGAFEEAHKTPCVVLLDEIDAFGKSRDDPHDVGELKRLVTTLLVELDRWPPGKLIVGATNHPGLLDHALERRFRTAPHPRTPRAQTSAQGSSPPFCEPTSRSPRGTLQALLELTKGATGSDSVAAVRAAIRKTVLQDEPLDLALLREALPTDRSGIPRDVKAAIARAAAEHAGLPHRTIAELLELLTHDRRAAAQRRLPPGDHLMADPANSPRDRPLLGGGERLAREAQPARAPAEKYHPQSIEEAMGRLGPAARDIRQRTQSMPAKLRGERIILEATLLPNYLAASYHPSQLRDDADLVAIGTRNATGTLRTARKRSPTNPRRRCCWPRRIARCVASRSSLLLRPRGLGRRY